jgi:hypothetical protein
VVDEKGIIVIIVIIIIIIDICWRGQYFIADSHTCDSWSVIRDPAALKHQQLGSLAPTNWSPTLTHFFVTTQLGLTTSITPPSSPR